MKFLKQAKVFGLKDKVFMSAYGLAEGTLIVTGSSLYDDPFWLKLDRNELRKGKINILERGNLVDIQNFINENDEKEVYILSNGMITDGHQLLIMDQANGVILNNLEIGEVCIIGPSVTKGYWDEKKNIEESFIYNKSLNKRYLRTGDMGFLDNNGDLYIVSRIRDLIMLNNLVYFPQDIERTSCNAVPELEADGAAAFTITHLENEIMVIIQEITRAARKSPQCEKWAKQIRENVFKVHGVSVAIIVFLPPGNIPRTTSGKMQRNKAKEKFLNYDWKKELVSLPSLNSKRLNCNPNSASINISY